MSNYIDERYIKMMGMYVERFTDIGNDSYNCRCPLCGDSRKSKTKARGFFYKSENGNWRYKCHNCAENISFYEFIERVAPTLFQEYKFEVFSDKKEYSKRFRVKNKKDDTPKQAITSEVKKFDLNVFHKVDMNESNEFTAYLRGRKIPTDMAERLYYTDDLEPIVHKLDGYKDKDVYIKRGIIIPYFDTKGNFEAFQIRNIDKKSEVRYLTYDVNPSDHIFNLADISPNQRVYVFEGAFDSMFCKNAVCASGSSIFNKLNTIKEINPDIAVVFDNDFKTNTVIYDLLMKVIKSGYKVVIFDDRMRGYKDINDYAKATNKTIDEITVYLESCTFEGLTAELHIADIFKKMQDLKKKKQKDDFGLGKSKTKTVFDKNNIFSI